MEPINLQPIQQIKPLGDTFPLHQLPQDLIASIFSYLPDNRSVQGILLSCQRFKAVILKDLSIKRRCVERQFQHGKAHLTFDYVSTLHVRRFEAVDTFFRQENPVKDIADADLNTFSKRIHRAHELYADYQKTRVLLHTTQVVGCGFILCCQWGPLSLIMSLFNSYANDRCEGPFVWPGTDDTDYLRP